MLTVISFAVAMKEFYGHHQQVTIMATENKVLMQQAREALKGKWDMAVLAWFIFFLITGSFSAGQFYSSVSPIVALIIGGPMAYGMAYLSLNIARHGMPKLAQIFEGFNQFSRLLIAYLLMMLYITLWMLLLIIPGIIAAIAYSQTFYILTEDTAIAPADALRRSKEIMHGYKQKYFFLCLRFLGWALLCLLTLGIGFLWLGPYMQVSFARFYDDLKADRLARGLR